MDITGEKKDNDSYKVSVIIPVYNVEKYLEKSLDSVISQTYKNLEIILVDDGSTDRSGEICDKYQSKDSRVNVIHQENSGVSAARNLGLDMATGDAVIFIDPDDYIDLTMMEDMIKALKKNSADVVICGYRIVSDNKEIERRPLEGILKDEDIIGSIFTEQVFSAVWNKMFCKNILMDENLNYYRFPVGIYIGEDFVWLSKVMGKCRKAYCLEKAYYHWLTRKESATSHDEGIIRIDDKALTEIDALKMVTDICCLKSKMVHREAAFRYYGVLMSKIGALLKSERALYHIEIYNKLDELISSFPYQKLSDRIKILRAKLIIIMYRLHVNYRVLSWFVNITSKNRR